MSVNAASNFVRRTESETNSVAELAQAKTITPRFTPKGENTLYQGVIALADGSTVSLPAAERFRMLRAKLERMNLGEKRYQVISVSSSVPQEGKSVTAVNLARALGSDGVGRTLLVDADLRRPTVHNYFSMPREPGLSDVLYGRYALPAVIRQVQPGLDVLTAGSVLADPARAIELPEFVDTINMLKAHYRYLILDCPPILVCPEPITISSIADTTLLVVRAWRTTSKLVEDAVSVVGRSRIMGVVMNDGVDASREYLEYGYYGYRPVAQKSAVAE